jgi:hypothetical protein
VEIMRVTGMKPEATCTDVSLYLPGYYQAAIREKRCSWTDPAGSGRLYVHPTAGALLEYRPILVETMGFVPESWWSFVATHTDVAARATNWTCWFCGRERADLALTRECVIETKSERYTVARTVSTFSAASLFVPRCRTCDNRELRLTPMVEEYRRSQRRSIAVAMTVFLGSLIAMEAGIDRVVGTIPVGAFWWHGLSFTLAGLVMLLVGHWRASTYRTLTEELRREGWNLRVWPPDHSGKLKKHPLIEDWVKDREGLVALHTNLPPRRAAGTASRLPQ